MSGQMAEQEGKRLELLKRLLPSFSRGRVRSKQSGRRRSELPMTVGTASTREFARRLCPVWALTGSAARPKAFSCVRQVQQIGHGDGDWFTQVNNNIPLFDRQDHPFVPTCLRQSAARSGSQGCRPRMRRHRRSRREASLTERARC